MQNPVVHDFIVLVYVYLNVIKSNGINFPNIQNNINFNNNRLNELCKKMNFDALEIK